jgi:hypothetical protein
MEYLFLAYAVISILAIWRTYLEQRNSGVRSPIFVAIGYLLCIIWPATVVVFASFKSLRRA